MSGPSGQPGHPAPPSGAAAGARAAVRQALDAVRSDLERDPAAAPDLRRMAAAAGVSPRTLQRHFRRVLARSPHAAAERLRLDAARQALLSGEASSVLSVAVAHGFDHAGRFAIRYALAFGEAPSMTLRRARAAAPAAGPPAGTQIILAPLHPAAPGDASRARRASEELAIALGRARDLVPLGADPARERRPGLRLGGRVAGGGVVLTLAQSEGGLAIWSAEQTLARRGGIGWADRAAGAVVEMAWARRVDQARRIPRHRLPVDALVLRARPAALSQEPGLVAMAIDLLGEALMRDPTHARGQALAAWSHAVAAQHCFARDTRSERAAAHEHAARALALAPDDPEVLTPVAGALSLMQRLEEAEGLAKRSLALDPHQPEALRRLGFIANFRGDGRAAARAFRRALALYPAGNNGTMALVGLGIAHFILGDDARSARTLARAVDQQPSRAWPNRFLAAAAMHAGAAAEARRALAAFRNHFPDLTVSACAQSDALHAATLDRVLDGLARAGLPP